MATTYTPLSPQDLPASIETEPTVDGLIKINNAENLSFIISGNNGVTNTIFTVLNTGNQFWNNPKDAVDYLNNLGNGIAPNDIEWYVPGSKVFTNIGLVQNTGGNRIGVRTKTYKGFNALLKVNTISTGVGVNKINFPISSGTPPFNRGVQGYTELLTNPSPGDPFIAQSVNIYEKGLRDRSAAIFSDEMKFATPLVNGVIAENYGPDAIRIYPISGLQLLNRDNNKPIFTYTTEDTYITDTLVADTIYYVYAFYEANSLQFEISTVGTPNRINKTGDPSKKYLLSFCTDGTGVIRPFYKEGSVTTFIPDIRFLLDGSSLAPVLLQLDNYVPSTTQLINVRAFFQPDPGAVTSNALLFPGGLGAVATGIVLSGKGNIKRDAFLTLVTSQFRNIEYEVITAGDKLSLFLSGYIE